MDQHEGNKIGLFAATIIGINAMIGAGIFAMPAKLAYTVGLASMFSYALSGVLVLFIVLALGRLAVLYPGDAWGYRYPALWGGHMVGMIASLGYVGGVTIAMGFLTQQLGVQLMPYLGYDPLTIGLVLLGILVALVLAGTQISSWGQYLIAACVLVPMIVSSIICCMHTKPALMSPIAPYGYDAVITALPLILFSMLGFESISSLYGIVVNPGRNVPRAALYSVVIVASMFSLFIASSLAAIDKSFFVGGMNQAFSQAIAAALPGYEWLGWLISIGAFFAIFGTLHSMVWSVAELFLDVMRKAQNCVVRSCFTGKLLNERVAVLIIGGSTALSAFVVQPGTILQLTSAFVALAYLLSVMALLFDRRTWQTLYDAVIAVGACVSAFWLCWLSVQSTLAVL
ncbi:MAG: basic amino acid/polyamine antiporter, family [Candidatus Dependentiae bacterium]|nr:basic amino acid/polyamine antiporter, family [Candidatus Dependentiae bacterium]